MTKAELQSKHLAELHELAADAGVERYRMLSRAELIEKLAGGESKPAARQGGEGAPRRRRDQGGGGKPRQTREPRERGRREPQPEGEAEPREKPKPQPSIAAATAPPPKRKRRRRRWGRRRKAVRVHDLLLPPTPGRQAIVYAESRVACTALLREIAAELAEASSGPDPVALLVDPSPEELADWKREAPRAEIVSAGKAQHAEDAIAQARTRADGGDEVIVLIDSLTRFADSFGGTEETRALIDAAAGALVIVAALERPAQ